MKAVLWVTISAVVVAVSADVSELPSQLYLPSSGYLPVSETDEQKHFYFYASPNDEYYTKFRINVVPKHRKNTKVVFIKAPHHAGVVPEVNAPESSLKDRTLVYVLLKKPKESQSVDIAAGLGVKHAKPEVSFIKYDNRHDAAHKIHSGIHGHRVGSNVPNLENDHEFLSTLDKEHGKHGHSGPY